MTAFNVATTVLFAGLGLVALALGLLARSYSTAVLATGLVGLLGLAAASTWITYAGPANEFREIGRLRAENERQSAEQRRLLARIQELEVRPAARPAATTAAPPAEPQQGTAKAHSGAEWLTAELQAEKAARSRAERNEAAANAKASDFENRLRLAVAQPDCPAPSGPAGLAIRRTLDNPTETPFYAAEPLAQRELVVGLKGSWYVFRLKRSGKPFVFVDRRFRMPDATEELIESVRRLRAEVIAPLVQAKSARLFLRGSADSRRIAGRTEQPAGRALAFLPVLPGGAHANEARVQPLASPVRNEDLPGLRADWVRELIRPELVAPGAPDIEILENPPAPGRQRTVELLLYVDW